LLPELVDNFRQLSPLVVVERLVCKIVLPNQTCHQCTSKCRTCIAAFVEAFVTPICETRTLLQLAMYLPCQGCQHQPSAFAPCTQSTSISTTVWTSGSMVSRELPERCITQHSWPLILLDRTLPHGMSLQQVSMNDTNLDNEILCCHPCLH